MRNEPHDWNVAVMRYYIELRYYIDRQHSNNTKSTIQIMDTAKTKALTRLLDQFYNEASLTIVQDNMGLRGWASKSRDEVINKYVERIGKLIESISPITA